MRKIDIKLYELAGASGDSVQSNLNSLSSGLNNSGFKEFMSSLGSELGLAGDCNYAVQCLEAAAAILIKSRDYIENLKNSYSNVKLSSDDVKIPNSAALVTGIAMSNIGNFDCLGTSNFQGWWEDRVYEKYYNKTENYFLKFAKKNGYPKSKIPAFVIETQLNTKFSKAPEYLYSKDGGVVLMRVRRSNSSFKWIPYPELKPTLAHEFKGHWVQHIKAENPVTVKDKLFAQNIKNYIEPEVNYARYWKQPVEANARAVEALEKVGAVEKTAGRVAAITDRAVYEVAGIADKVVKTAGKVGPAIGPVVRATGKTVGAVAVAYPVAKGLTSEAVIGGNVAAAGNNFKVEYDNLYCDAAIIGAFARVGNSNCSILERIDNICGAIVEPIMQPLKLLDTLIEGTAGVVGSAVVAGAKSVASYDADNLESLKEKIRF